MIWHIFDKTKYYIVFQWQTIFLEFRKQFWNFLKNYSVIIWLFTKYKQTNKQTKQKQKQKHFDLNILEKDFFSQF